MPTAVEFLDGYRQNTRRIRTYPVLTYIIPVCIYRLFLRVIYECPFKYRRYIVSDVMLCGLAMNGGMPVICFEVPVPYRPWPRIEKPFQQNVVTFLKSLAR
jgi:hypothetical protein